MPNKKHIPTIIRHTTSRYWIGIFVLFLSGCSEPNPVPPTSPIGDPIGFRTELAETRAAAGSFTGSGTIHSIQKFGVFAYISGSSVPYMNNTPVSRTATTATWESAPLFYWPIETVDFYAYAHNDPFSGSRTTPYTLPEGFDDVAGVNTAVTTPGAPPKFAMTVDAYPHFQVDLLLAMPQLGKTKSATAVNMLFKHMMTKILFSARVKVPTSAENPIKITDIKLLNVYDSGEIEMNAAKEWTVNTTAPKRKYWLHIIDTPNGNKELVDKALTTSYQMLSTPEGVLLLLPQTLPQDARIEVTFRAGNQPPVTFSVALPISSPVWEKGKALNYQIEIDNGVYITAKPEEWNIVLNDFLID